MMKARSWAMAHLLWHTSSREGCQWTLETKTSTGPREVILDSLRRAGRSDLANEKARLHRPRLEQRRSESGGNHSCPYGIAGVARAFRYARCPKAKSVEAELQSQR